MRSGSVEIVVAHLLDSVRAQVRYRHLRGCIDGVTAKAPLRIQQIGILSDAGSRDRCQPPVCNELRLFSRETIALRPPSLGSMSAIEIFRQLGRGWMPLRWKFDRPGGVVT
jgi:hypothetical protein